MTDIGFVFRIISLTSLIFICSACNASSTTPSSSDFEKLCNIYKNVSKEYKDTNDLLLSQGSLYRKIQAEIPNMLDDYEHVITAAPEERYQLYQQVAEIRLKKKWDCPAAESYYSGIAKQAIQTGN